MNSSTFDKVCQHAREIAILSSVEGLLGWDERTKMPQGAGAYRAEQLTYLAGKIHQLRTAPEFADWLDELAQSPLAEDKNSDQGATIHHLKRACDKQRKLPQQLVEALTKATVLGQQAWDTSRQNDDFTSFQPHLEEILNLRRQETEAVGYTDNRYDPLLDDYEPGESTSTVAQVLEDLRKDLVPLVAAVTNAKQQPKFEILEREYPVDVQKRFGTEAAKAIGFDFNRGRLDVTNHPFCSGMGPNDIRITTRYHDDFFSAAFFGILHEAGHGIYEQGLRGEQFGLPPGSYTSLGIHESQSRLWENAVGRSRAFWEFFFDDFRAAFPQVTSDVSLDEFYFAINRVGPSLTRVEADEATYNLHIIIRFELEQALINDDLPVADLPAAWNERYEKYLGITPPDNASGVLQDIHWSAGLIGYFPTYSLGNLYAAQFFEKADDALGGLDDQFRRGEFATLREWLRENIHQHGQCYSSAELVQRVTGKPLSHRPLIEYLTNKLTPLYEL